MDLTDAPIHAVTGAYGYSGKYIAQRLLDEGNTVITLTNSLSRRNPFGDRIKAFPFHFDQPDLLTEQLRGVSVLYNTYWVRFNHRLFKHADAVRNTLVLFEAAKKAGVQRIVHVSITNPSEDSPLEYFRGKAVLEKALIASGVSYAILRPAVLFGKEDILINNIAWALRRLPVFGVFGDGQYRLQPIYVDDLASLAVEQGKKRENIVINAIGPESFTYRELVAKIGQLIGKERPDHFCCPVVRLCCGLAPGVARWRRGNHEGGDRGPHGRPAARRCTACRAHGPDRLDQIARRRFGAILHQRVGKAERPGIGVQVELKRGFLLAAKSITPIAAEIKWGSDSPYIRLCKTQECFRARLLPKPWLYRHHANTMRQRTLRAEVRVLLAYLDFFVRKVSSNLARASRRPICRTATNAARLSFPG